MFYSNNCLLNSYSICKNDCFTEFKSGWRTTQYVCRGFNICTRSGKGKQFICSTYLSLKLSAISNYAEIQVPLHKTVQIVLKCMPQCFICVPGCTDHASVTTNRTTDCNVASRPETEYSIPKGSNIKESVTSMSYQCFVLVTSSSDIISYQCFRFIDIIQQSMSLFS